jgi:uncharacterized membrane protein
MAGKLSRIVLVLWAGSLWALALWVAPLVFRLAPDRHAAGVIASGLFQAETYATLAIALIALWRCGRQRCGGIYLAAGLLVINEFIIKKLLDYVRVMGKIAGLGFGGWHGISAVLYVIACLAAVLVVWKDDFR